MSIKRILVPTDGSGYIEEALVAAITIAKASGATVTAMNVVDATPLASLRPDAYETVAVSLEKDGREAVEAVRRRCEAEGVPAETLVVRGRAADEIVRASADHDLVVMPTLGKSGTGRFLIGSVAEKVVSTAECWVLTVRVPRGDGNRA